jgi:hypothetical protein
MFTGIVHTIFPVALQNLFLCVLGVQLFYFATIRLHVAGIDFAAALGYGWGTDRLLHDTLQVLKCSWLIYLAALVAHPFFPLVNVVAWCAFLALLLVPSDYFGGTLRRRFISSFLRTITLFSWSSPTPLIDVVVGDILTSYAKVFAAWDALIFCYLLGPSGQCIPSILSVLLVW